MAQCPYSEYVIDETDNKVYENPWHSVVSQASQRRESKWSVNLSLLV